MNTVKDAFSVIILGITRDRLRHIKSNCKVKYGEKIGREFHSTLSELYKLKLADTVANGGVHVAEACAIAEELAETLATVASRSDGRESPFFLVFIAKRSGEVEQLLFDDTRELGKALAFFALAPDVVRTTTVHVQQLIAEVNTGFCVAVGKADVVRKAYRTAEMDQDRRDEGLKLLADFEERMAPLLPQTYPELAHA